LYLVDTRDELVLDDGTITFPVFSILNGAAISNPKIQSSGGMDIKKKESTVQSHGHNDE
jgi:hypothetical protein